MEHERPSQSLPVDPSRRAFLASTAALAGVAVACQATVGGSEAPVPKSSGRAQVGPNDTIRIGLIGTGGMGNGHLDGLVKYKSSGKENALVVALSDVCKPRLDASLAKCREKQGCAVDGYRDYKELLARDDLHAVLIASPEHWHAQMAEDAIAAGLDVYLEKPMTLRLKDALRLKKVVDKNDRRLQVGTQYMLWPKFHEAKKLVASGAIGKPTLSQTSYCRNSKDGEWLYGIDENVKPGEMLDWEAWLGPAGAHEWDTEVYHRWRRYRDFSTGIVGDLLVHQMTPMMLALDVGWPVRVTASGGHYVDKAMENHDNVFLTIEFEKEHTMVVAGSTCNEQGLEVLIRGHQGNLYLGGNDCVLRPERIFADDVDEQTVKGAELDTQDALRLDWLRCVRTRDEVASPVEFGTRHMVIVDLATRSLWEGGAYTFDPKALKAARV